MLTFTPSDTAVGPLGASALPCVVRLWSHNLLVTCNMIQPNTADLAVMEQWGAEVNQSGTSHEEGHLRPVGDEVL